MIQTSHCKQKQGKVNKFKMQAKTSANERGLM